MEIDTRAAFLEVENCLDLILHALGALNSEKPSASADFKIFEYELSERIVTLKHVVDGFAPD